MADTMYAIIETQERRSHVMDDAPGVRAPSVHVTSDDAAARMFMWARVRAVVGTRIAAVVDDRGRAPDPEDPTCLCVRDLARGWQIRVVHASEIAAAVPVIA
jgi:hypothetical protein